MTKAEKRQAKEASIDMYKIKSYADKFTRLAYLLNNWEEIGTISQHSALAEIMNVAGQAHREFAGLVAVFDYIDNLK